jgi:hypothetical protein
VEIDVVVHAEMCTTAFGACVKLHLISFGVWRGTVDRPTRPARLAVTAAPVARTLDLIAASHDATTPSRIREVALFRALFSCVARKSHHSIASMIFKAAARAVSGMLHNLTFELE